MMLRGNGGEDIFFDDSDRHYLYELLHEGVQRYGHRIHGFCCMSNHIHLALQVADEPLSQIMQNLSFRYTRWINRKRGRTGHVFQGRYKAILIDADSYLLELIRYIHLNPVRAGLAEDPVDYAWSGHRAYLGLTSLPWLHTEWILGLFAKRLNTCRKRYAAFVQEGAEEGFREDFHQGGKDGRVLADDRFLQKVLGKSRAPLPEVTLQEIAALVSRDYGLDDSELRGPSRNRVLSEARAVIGWLARQLGAASTKETAFFFHREASTFSRHIGKIDAEARASKVFRKLLKGYINTLTQA